VGTAFSRQPGDIPGSLDQPAVEVARSALSPSATTRPYPPSWIDRLTARVERLPMPPWAFYLAVGLVLSLVYLPVLLSLGGSASGGFPLYAAVLYSLLTGMTCAYLPAMVHYLDTWAAGALARFRPVLTVDDTGYERLRYQLTTLPARPALVASLLGVLYTVADILTPIFTAGDGATIELSPLTAVFLVFFNVLIYVLAAVVVYHTLHQLRMVNDIYTRHTRINIFQQGPLYALSGLTARTAVGLGIPTYLWFQANSLTTMGNSASDVIQTIFLGIIVVVAFVWPLLGAHRLLEREKQRLLDEAARCVEDAIANLNNHVTTGDLATAKELKEALEGLVIEQGVIDRLRTWPWRTETVRGIGVAFLLPVFIWVVQRVLERLGV
jgi:uncharacterized membrane protein YidH (DUF202 family)